MKQKISQLKNPQLEEKITKEIDEMKCIKNFRSQTAEEWYVFLPSYSDPQTKGAVGKVIIHYDLQGNRDVYINTTIIFDAPKLFDASLYPLVYAVSDELVNRLVGLADTLLSVHAGGNSFHAEYIRKQN